MFNLPIKAASNYIGNARNGDSKFHVDNILFPPNPNHVSDDAKLTFEQMTRNEGLEFEEFTVITEDGYYLQVFHMFVPGLKPGSPVVFFQHGLFSSADTWIAHKDKSPAFRAAKAGYDVWLGNNRGTEHSRKHTKYSATKNYKEYFDYSFFELGKYDAPA